MKQMSNFLLLRIFENPGIDFSLKYSYLNKQMLLTFFYCPLFPLGGCFSLFGTIMLFFIEKYNVVRFYKPPSLLNEKLAFNQFAFFRFVILAYSIAQYIFMRDNFQNWSLACLIVGCILVFVQPYSILLPNLVNMTEEELYPETFKETYYDFKSDYERSNPFTKSKGFYKYFKSLKEMNEFTDNEIKKICHEIETTEENNIEEFIIANCSQKKGIECYENSYYGKVINQQYIDSYWESPHNEEFLNKFYLRNLILCRIFSSRKSRHSKKFLAKNKNFLEKSSLRKEDERRSYFSKILKENSLPRIDIYSEKRNLKEKVPIGIEISQIHHSRIIVQNDDKIPEIEIEENQN